MHNYSDKVINMNRNYLVTLFCFSRWTKANEWGGEKKKVFLKSPRRSRSSNALSVTPHLPLRIYIHCLCFIVAYSLISGVLSDMSQQHQVLCFLGLSSLNLARCNPWTTFSFSLSFTPSSMTRQAPVCLYFWFYPWLCFLPLFAKVDISRVLSLVLFPAFCIHWR